MSFEGNDETTEAPEGDAAEAVAEEARAEDAVGDAAGGVNGEEAPARQPGPPPEPPRSVEERVAERTERRQRTARSRRAYRAKQRERRRQQGPGEAAAQPPAAEHGPGRPRVRQGVVVSDKADKTLVVRIDVTRQHRVYKKTIRESSTLHAHDERNEAHEGDTVRVVESRPLSRTKRWRLTEVVERAR